MYTQVWEKHVELRDDAGQRLLLKCREARSLMHTGFKAIYMLHAIHMLYLYTIYYKLDYYTVYHIRYLYLYPLFTRKAIYNMSS